MTVSQFDWSPHSQVRWVEVQNTGSDELPAHSPVEVTGVTRPDLGRVVHQVKRCTGNSLNQVLVLGPRKLQENDYGLATDAVMCYARVNGSPSVGDEVGTVTDQTYFDSGQMGWVVISAEDSENTDVFRVMRIGGGGRDHYFGKPKAAHATDTWQIYDIYQLVTTSSGPGIPPVIIPAPGLTKEVYQNSGFTYSENVLHHIFLADTDGEDPDRMYVSTPHELLDCEEDEDATEEKRATVSTSDATQTTLDTITLNTDQAYHLEVDVVVRQTSDSSKTHSWRLAANVLNDGGTASVEDTTTLHDGGSAAFSPSVTLDATGADIRIRVTGISSTALNWRSRAILMQV